MSNQTCLDWADEFYSYDHSKCQKFKFHDLNAPRAAIGQWQGALLLSFQQCAPILWSHTYPWAPQSPVMQERLIIRTIFHCVNPVHNKQLPFLGGQRGPPRVQFKNPITGVQSRHHWGHIPPPPHPWGRGQATRYAPPGKVNQSNSLNCEVYASPCTCDMAHSICYGDAQQI